MKDMGWAPPLNEAEREVFAKIVDDLNCLDVDSQRIVCMKIVERLDDDGGTRAYRSWPMFPPNPR
jgi:hypothetical protein